jgi:hypothetical protein
MKKIALVSRTPQIHQSCRNERILTIIGVSTDRSTIAPVERSWDCTAEFGTEGGYLGGAFYDALTGLLSEK